MQMITFGMLEAKDGQSDALLTFVKDHMKYINEQPGLVHGYMAKAKGNDHKFVVVSVWESEEAQQAAMMKLSSDPGATRGFIEMMQLVQGQPDFGNYIVESISK